MKLIPNLITPSLPFQIVFVLLSMCLFCTFACAFWESMTGSSFQIYLPWDAQAVPNPDDKLAGATIISVLIFFSYAIVLNTGGLFYHGSVCLFLI